MRDSTSVPGVSTGDWQWKSDLQETIRNSVLQGDPKLAESAFSCEEVHKLNLKSGSRAKDYARNVFAHRRALLGITPALYLSMLCDSPLLATPSPGKSRATLFVGGGFLVKTLSRREVVALRHLLPAYVAHCRHNIGTLLAPLLGLHRVQSIHVVIMANILPITATSLKRYDLKGSTRGRLANPNSTVKKDLDWLSQNESISLSPADKTAFLAALAHDVHFLAAHGLMDYSILVGIAESPNIEPPWYDLLILS
jgi:hypothetical protein